MLGILFSLLAFVKPLSSAQGFLFDAFLTMRPKYVPSSEILLIEVDNEAIALEGELPWTREDVDKGLVLLTEMNALSVVIDRSVEKEEPPAEGLSNRVGEVLDREFLLIKDNIGALFEAIRLGSIRPKDSSLFVNKILSLTDESKLRLVEALSPEGVIKKKQVANDIHIFGRGESDEHLSDIDRMIVRRTFSRLGLSEEEDFLGQALFSGLRNRHGDGDIPLDENGAVLVETLRETEENGFRRISAGRLIGHIRLENDLAAELKSMDKAGYLSFWIEGVSPLLAYEAAKRSDDMEVREWQRHRERFFESTARFLNSEVEKRLLSGYDRLLLSPELTPEGKTSLQTLRMEVRQSFARARTVLEKLVELRAGLKKEIEKSICLVVPVLPGPVSRVTVAASFADSLVSGRFLHGVSSAWAFNIAALLVFIFSVILTVLTPFAAGLVGGTAVIVAGLITLMLFIFSGIWLNPFLLGLPLSALTLSSVFSGRIVLFVQKRSLRRTLAPHMAPPRLDECALTYAGKGGALPTERREACILAVRAKKIAVFPPEASGDVSAEARRVVAAYRIYHETIGDLLKSCGAYLYALEDELILAAFGAPLSMDDHRLCAELAASAVIEAEDGLARLLEASGLSYKRGTLTVGIDCGDCDFGDTNISGFCGYAAFGTVPVRARVLSGLGERYGCRILVTENVRRVLPEGTEAVRLDKLVTEREKTEEYFYSLRFPSVPSLEGRSASARIRATLPAPCSGKAL